MTITTDSVIKKLLVLFLVIAGLYFAKDFLIPLSIGTVLATLFLPLSQWLERRRIPKALAATICLLSFILAIAIVFALLGWQIRELTKDFDLIKQRGTLALESVQQYVFNTFGVSAEKQSSILLDQQSIFGSILNGMAVSTASVFSTFLFILVYILFLLYYRSHIKQFLLKLAPAGQTAEMNTIINSVAKVSQQYLVGLFKMIVCLWIMYGIGFSALGVKNALFFAFLCGLLEIVPFIGNITGTSITLLMAAAQGASPLTLVGIAGTYGVAQFIQGWVLEPLIVGAQVKINPLFTILALVLGELIWGLPGIFLAIPLMAMFKIVCDNITSLQPYGFLIGETVAASNSPSFMDRLRRKKSS